MAERLTDRGQRSGLPLRGEEFRRWSVLLVSKPSDQTEAEVAAEDVVTTIRLARVAEGGAAVPAVVVPAPAAKHLLGGECPDFCV